MTSSERNTPVTRTHRQPAARLLIPLIAVLLTVLAGVATVWALPDPAIRGVSFATMIAAVASGIVAVRRGPTGMRAVSAIVALLTLMLGSTFFGLTY